MKEVFEKARQKLHLLYDEFPDIRILSRFESEKLMLQGYEDCVRQLDLLAKLRHRAEEKDEHIRVSGAVGNLFISYLLGATTINPLPLHEYCPTCKRVVFSNRAGTPLDGWHLVCSCGAEMVVDGWGLPFETALSYAQRGKVNVSVSQEFEEEAEQLLKEWGVSEGITLKTDVLMRDANGNILEALQDLTSGNVAGIPHVDSPNGFWQETVRKTGASSASDLLKIMGFLHSRSVWTDNADKLFVAHRVTLFHIPASPEDVFDMIVEKLRAQGVADVGFALDVAEKAKRGYYQKTGGMDETTRLALLELGFELEFIFFLEEIVYLFPKAKAIEYLKEAIAATRYRRR